MSLACREYMTCKGCDTVKDATILREAIGNRLRVWLAEKRIRGFEVISVRNDDDILENDLDGEALHEASGGVFPFIWVNVTFDSGTFDAGTLAPIEHEYGLSLLVEFHR